MSAWYEQESIREGLAFGGLMVDLAIDTAVSRYIRRAGCDEKERTSKSKDSSDRFISNRSTAS